MPKPRIKYSRQSATKGKSRRQFREVTVDDVIKDLLDLFDHLGLDPKLTGNFRMTYYQAGHMFYTNKPSAAELRKNLVGFYSSNQ